MFTHTRARKLVVREEFLTGGSKRFLLSLSLSLSFTALRERFLRALLLTSFFPKSFSILSEFFSLGFQSAFEGLLVLIALNASREQTRSYFSLPFSRRTHRETTEGTQQEKSAERAFLKIKSHVFVPPRREKSADKCIVFVLFLLREKR